MRPDLKCEAETPGLRIEGASEAFEITALADGDGPKAKKFAVVAYTGAAMRLRGFSLPVVVDLAGLKVPRQDIPALREHDPERIVGHTTVVEVSPQRVKVSGVVSGTGDAAREVVDNAANGYPWQASIGAAAERIEFVDRGETVKVNGRSFTGPLYVARAAVLGEFSFVSLGADAATSARVAAHHTGAVPMNFTQWLAARGITDPEGLSDAVRTTLQAAFDAEQKAAEAKPAPPAGPAAPQFDTAGAIAASRREIAAEVERVNAIRAACARNGNPTVEVEEGGQKRRVSLEAHAVASGWAADRAEMRAELESLRAKRPETPAAGGGPSALPPGEVISAAICQAAGLPNVDRHFKPEVLEAAHASYKGRFSLKAFVVEAAQANGYSGRSDLKSNYKEIFRHAFSPNVQAAQFSTFGGVSGILSDDANKFLLAGYNLLPSSWRLIAARRTVTDFKTVTSYRPTGDFEFEEVAGDGEIKHGALAEEEYSNRVRTYAKMFAITRQDIVNDDLGAFTTVPQRLGMGAAKALRKAFWKAFVNNASLFPTNNGNKNYISGSTTTLTAEGLRQAMVKLRQQTDANGDVIDLQPRYLIVPPELEGAARELLTSMTFTAGGGASGTQLATANIYKDMNIDVIVVPELSNSAYTGNSATAWYLVTDPMVAALVEVAFLDGVETPTIESADTDFNTLGVQWRGFFDFGVSLQDYRGGVKSKGAA